MSPSPAEIERRDGILRAIEYATKSAITIRLEPIYAGTLGEYVYAFEGEEDLLHLIVRRGDDGPLTVAEGRAVADFALPRVDRGLVWFKPGRHSQHFYVGHDDLVSSLCATS
jgi:hypothetical protein